MSTPRFLRAGERGVLVEFPALTDTVAARAALALTPIPGVTGVASGARTLMLQFDPRVTSRPAVEAGVEAAVARPEPGAGNQLQNSPLIEIPVTYDGPDLAETAELLGLSAEQLVAEHTTRTWVCAFGGFAPGFGYLVADAPPLEVPRLATPRVRVPAGAVGLAGEFSGVYPRESPGGWRLIGRTELSMWDLSRTPPAAVAVGAKVRFLEAGS